MNTRATSKRVPSSPRTCRGEVDWEFLVGYAGIAFLFAAMSGLIINKVREANKKPVDAVWEVQSLSAESDGVMCYILTTPKGAVDLECLPYHYEVEENQDEYETRT